MVNNITVRPVHSFSNCPDVIPRPSIGDLLTTSTKINPHQKKTQKVPDFQTFTGQQVDWCTFERKFVAVANSQGYGHILQINPLFHPTLDQETEFLHDSKYIFQAFSYTSLASMLGCRVENVYLSLQASEKAWKMYFESCRNSVSWSRVG